MSNLISMMRSRLTGPQESRSSYPLDELVEMFNYGGWNYPLHQTMTGGDEERISSSFSGYVESAYKSNGVVFACMLVRLLLFSEARFSYRRIRGGRPGDLFGTPALRLLERPWPGGTTGDLLTRMIQDADLAGNAYITPVDGGRRLKRLRPDWVTIVLGSEEEPQHVDAARDVRVVGYRYDPGGVGSGAKPILLWPEEVAHFAPVPDPIANFRGMSWLTPVVREIQADSAATRHKSKFFENGATPNLVVKVDPKVTLEAFREFKKDFNEEHQGAGNAYKTMFLGGGADATVVGSDFRQMSFATTQGAGETRIAAAAGVPPVIVGLSEGLQAATYSNYGQARRRFADGTMHPLWRNAAGSLARIIDVPSDAELWFDVRDIPFLSEDAKDAAEIQSTHARTLRALTDAGWTPESALNAVMSGDFSGLEHSGRFSVQLHLPGEGNGVNGGENQDGEE